MLLLFSGAGLFLRVRPEDGYGRRELYLAGTLTGAGLGALGLLFWVFEGRPVSPFGLLTWGGSSTVLAAGAAWGIGLLLLLALIRRGLLRGPLLRLYRSFDWIMPRTRKELGSSCIASAAAAAGEEIAFRGFLLWYLTVLGGPALGVAGSSLLFGAAHGYQGRLGVTFAALAGAGLAATSLSSGSLLLAIWIHATYNMASFTAGRLLLGGDGFQREPGSL